MEGGDALLYIGKVELTGVNTGKLAVLSEKEKMELLARSQQGDTDARERLVMGNLRLVLSVVQKFVNRGEQLDDLFQVGCIGLIKSIDHFDLTQDVRFSTYAVPMIVGEIRRFLRDNTPVRVSRSVRDLAYKAMQAREELQRTSQQEPTMKQIAERVGVPEEDVVLALEAVVEPVSLYEPVYSESGDTLCVCDQLGDDNDDRNWLGEISLRMEIAKLAPREKKILQLRFYQGKTQMEVAKQIGISQAQVSRLEKGALQRLKLRES